MAEIPRQREIIDRRALAAQLDAIAERSAEPDRKHVADALKAALVAGREEVRKRFEGGASGTETVHALSFLVDQIIRVLYDFVAGHVYPIANPTKGERLALIAVGGYGRGELAPFSDIDLLFLTPYKRTPHTEQVVEYVLYTLWDLGLKVGQSTRSVEETIRHAAGDLTIRTAVLEARYIWGDQELFAELKRRFDLEIARAISTRCSGSRNTSIAPTISTRSSSSKCCRRKRRSVSRGRRISSGRCAAISISWQAVPRIA